MPTTVLRNTFVAALEQEGFTVDPLGIPRTTPFGEAETVLITDGSGMRLAKGYAGEHFTMLEASQKATYLQGVMPSGHAVYNLGAGQRLIGEPVSPFGPGTERDRMFATDKYFGIVADWDTDNSVVKPHIRNGAVSILLEKTGGVLVLHEFNRNVQTAYSYEVDADLFRRLEDHAQAGQYFEALYALGVENEDSEPNELAEYLWKCTQWEVMSES